MDKKNWPSIGDNSQTPLVGEKDSSVKSVTSGSVILSSGDPSQGQDCVPGSSGQGASAIQTQTQSASAIWGSNSKLDSSDKIEHSDMSSVWGGTDSSKSNTVSQVSNMQQHQAGLASNNASQLGWGINSGQTGSQGSSGNPASGAQSDSGMSLPGSSASEGQSNDFGHAVWQGVRNINMSNSGLEDKPPSSTQSTGSGWGNQSSSVMTSGLSIPGGSASAFSSKEIPTGNPDSAIEQWGQSRSTVSSSVWGVEGGGGGKAHATGWGSPSPSPIPNAGTEDWGQMDTRKPVSSQWGQPQAGGGRGSTGSWTQPQQQERPSSGSSSSGWGDTAAKPETNSGGWGQNDRQTPAQSSWAAPGQTKPPSQSQWGSAGTTDSQWGASAASGVQPVTAGGTQAAWGSSSASATPRPIGSQAPVMSQQQPPQPRPGVPSSWAEAAGRGLPVPKAENPAVIAARMKKEEVINRAVNDTGEWGKTPIRQDTCWDTAEESPKLPRKPISSTSSAGSQEDNSHWNQPNTGTAVWESMRSDPYGGGGGSSSGASGGSDWANSGGSDNDSGTWNGPPSAQQNTNSNMWNGPPTGNTGTQGNTGGTGMWGRPPDKSVPPPGPIGNQWPGASVAPPPIPQQMPRQGSTGSWSGDDRSQQWAGPPRDDSWRRGEGMGRKPESWGASAATSQRPPDSTGDDNSDNVWDKNGTNLWGEPGKTEVGTWSAGQMRRNSSSSSWADDNVETGGWGEGGRGGPGSSGSGSDVDDGTQLWGDPTSQKSGGWRGPTPSNPMAGQPPPPGGPRPDKAPWGQPPPPIPKPGGWGDASRMEETSPGMWNSQVSKDCHLPDLLPVIALSECTCYLVLGLSLFIKSLIHRFPKIVTCSCVVLPDSHLAMIYCQGHAMTPPT